MYVRRLVNNLELLISYLISFGVAILMCYTQLGKVR